MAYRWLSPFGAFTRRIPAAAMTWVSTPSITVVLEHNKAPPRRPRLDLRHGFLPLLLSPPMNKMLMSGSGLPRVEQVNVLLLHTTSQQGDRIFCNSPSAQSPLSNN